MYARPRPGSLLNFRHPLAQGMDLCVLPDWDYDPLYRQLLTRTGTQTKSGSTWGGGLATTAGSQYVTAYWPKRKYDARTMLIVADFGAWTLYGGALTSGSQETFFYNGGSPYFQWHVHGASWNTSHTVIGSVNWAQTLQSLRGAVVVLSWNRVGDGYGRGYVNGRLAVTGGSSITTANDRTQTSATTSMLIGAAKSQSLGSSTHVLTANWARALGVSEIEDLSANPWLLFSSRRLVSMYVPSSGAQLKTLSVASTATASAVKSVGLNRSVTASGSATWLRQIGLSPSATASVIGAFERSINMARAVAASGSAAISQGLAFLRSLTASASGSAMLDSARQWLRELSTSAAGAVEWIRAISMERAADVAGSAGLSRSIARFIDVATSATATLYRGLFSTLSAAVSGVASLLAGAVGADPVGRLFGSIAVASVATASLVARLNPWARMTARSKPAASMRQKENP